MTDRENTARPGAEAALRESEQRLRAIVETVVDGIITIDARGRIESFNPAASRIFGYRLDEVTGRNVSMLMPSPERERHDGYIDNYLRTGEAKIIGIGRAVTGRRKDGSLFPMELAVAEVRLGERRLFTGLVRDISERRQLERAVHAATEQERARIARELHDSLGQQLGGLLFMMNGLRRDLLEAGSAHAETAGQLCEELSTALTHARNLAHALHTVSPAPDGLLQALENLAERIASDRRITCAFAGDPTALVHDVSVANHLYRIAQEAAHNALKHSGATRLDIELIRNEDDLTLRVRDDGAGFTSPATSRGLGLRSMEQRARLIGGRLSVRPAPTHGVEVVCVAPAAAVDTPAAPGDDGSANG